MICFHILKVKAETGATERRREAVTKTSEEDHDREKVKNRKKVIVYEAYPKNGKKIFDDSRKVDLEVRAQWEGGKPDAEAADLVVCSYAVSKNVGIWRVDVEYEIAELVGKENIYIFGEDSETVIQRYADGSYVSKDYYEKDAKLKEAVDFIVGEEMMAVGDKEHLTRLYNELLNKDWFMTFPDFEDYIATRERAYQEYNDRMAWAEKMLVNIAKAGFFSSDRTIAQYEKEIWKTGTL